VVGLLNRETGQYHLYVTNVPPEKLAAEDIGAVYSLRWQIEAAQTQARKMPFASCCIGAFSSSCAG
jgi:hypothetical protein